MKPDGMRPSRPKRDMGILRQLVSTPRALTVAYSMLTDDQVNSRVSKIRERPMKRYTRPLIILRDMQ